MSRILKFSDRNSSVSKKEFEILAKIMNELNKKENK